MRRLLLLATLGLLLPSIKPSASRAEETMQGATALPRTTLSEGAVGRRVRLNLARMAVNEATLYRNGPDMEAIWQVTLTHARRHGTTLRHILDAQRRLSPRVTGADERPGRYNLQWSRNLDWSDEEPEGWDEPMPWSTVVAQNLWRNTREHADMLVTELIQHNRWPRVCQGTALAWGGPGLDEAHLQRRNAGRVFRGQQALEPLDCGPTRNFFVGFPH